MSHFVLVLGQSLKRFFWPPARTVHVEVVNGRCQLTGWLQALVDRCPVLVWSGLVWFGRQLSVVGACL